MPIHVMISSIAGKLLDTLLFNYIFLPVYVIIILFIKMQYERYMDLQENICEHHRKTERQMIEESIFFGLVTGFIGSFIIVGAGITLNAGAFEYLFVVMILLALINVRFICFSYSAGILSIISLIFNISIVDVTSLLALTALIHFMESILIFINAGKDSVPAFIKHKGGIAGAFLTQKFWPVPIVFLTFLTQDGGAGLLHPGKSALGLGSAFAVLAYSDLAITKQPEKRSRETAFQIFCYSVILLIIAMASVHVYALKIVGALFTVIAHEGIILNGRRREKDGEPLFKPAGRGLKVFDILPGSHADRMGLQRGDTILNINGKDIQTEEGVNEAIKDFPTFVWVRVLDPDKNEKTYEYKCYPDGLNRLGILSVPRETEVTYNINYIENLGILKNLVARFKNINRSI